MPPSPVEGTASVSRSRTSRPARSRMTSRCAIPGRSLTLTSTLLSSVQSQNVAQTKMLGPRRVMSAKTVNISHRAAQPKVSTVYRYKTVQRVRNVTRFKDVNRTTYARRIHRTVTVTRVQPVIRTNVVTRVHHRTKVAHQTQLMARTQMLPMQTVTTGKTIQISHRPTHIACNRCK